MRRCPGTRCPELIPDHHTYCPTHAREYESRRGTRTARGYGTAHTRERARVARQVQTLQAYCRWCGLLVLPTEPWDLGHSDDRKTWTGAEHSRCNRSAAGTKGAKLRNH